MTNNELDGLFATARKTPAETSVTEVTAWLSAAALATASLGVLAKLKIIFLKKSIIMITGTIITSGVVAGVVLLNATNPKTPEKRTMTNAEITQTAVDDSIEQMTDPVFVFDSTKRDTKRTVAPEPLLPIVPLQPIRTASPIQPIQPAAPVSPSASKKSPAKEFQIVHIDGIYDVVIKLGAQPKVEVKNGGTFTEFANYEVKDGVFCTDCSDDLTNALVEGGELYITVTSAIREIHHQGVGDVKSESMIKLDKLGLWLSGVGDAELELECNNLTVEFNGVGDLKLIGASSSGEVTYSGVGDLKGYDFVFDVLKVTHNGVGNVQVFAARSITIEANGVGNVYYKGDPADEAIENNAIGKVKKK